MEPISNLSTEQARKLVGVCFDVDDTVTDRGLLNPEAFAALHALRAAGLNLIAATGRPLGWAELFARTWPINAAVGENGAGWHFLRDGKLKVGYAHDESRRRKEGHLLSALRKRVADEFVDIRESDDNHFRRCDVAFDVGETRNVPHERVRQLVALIEASGARAVVSSVHAHAAFGSYDKASGIRAAVFAALDRELETERDRWLFVGDSGNDAPAFAWFEWTAGVANVVRFLPQLPTPPRFVAAATGGAGFTEITNHILACRRGPH